MGINSFKILKYISHKIICILYYRICIFKRVNYHRTVPKYNFLQDLKIYWVIMHILASVGVFSKLFSGTRLKLLSVASWFSQLFRDSEARLTIYWWSSAILMRLLRSERSCETYKSSTYLNYYGTLCNIQNSISLHWESDVSFERPKLNRCIIRVCHYLWHNRWKNWSWIWTNFVLYVTLTADIFWVKILQI